MTRRRKPRPRSDGWVSSYCESLGSLPIKAWAAGVNQKPHDRLREVFSLPGINVSIVWRPPPED